MRAPAAIAIFSWFTTTRRRGPMITIAREDDTSRTTVRALAAAPTVFVVDDDVSVRDSRQRLVQTSGWRAETFASAEAFLARPRIPVPSCLVVHIAMIQLDGLDVQRRVAVERPETSVVFTGCADIRLVVRAMKAGAV